MSQRVFNFTAGPSMLPLPVLQRIQEEWLDFEGLGASVVEISHLVPEFKQVVFDVERLLREVLGVPTNYRIVLAHGGGALQFSMVPMNLIATRPARRAQYVLSGHFSRSALNEGARFGTVEAVASSEDASWAHIPALEPTAVDEDASYVHITTNNTMVGTRWHDFPDTGHVPLVGDATSELLSRRMDVSRFGVLYAGAQKNMGTSGLSVVLVREDLLGHALPVTPKMLNYTQLARDHSLSNTANTFAIYVARLMLQWIQTAGGLDAVEAANERKAKRVYDAIDRYPGFYSGHADAAHRSRMNIAFRLPTGELDARFIAEAEAQGLYALKGHRFFGGMRASVYNGMPEDGAQALAAFMDEFARTHG